MREKETVIGMLRGEKERSELEVEQLRAKLEQQEEYIRSQDKEMLNQKNEFQTKILALERDIIEFARFKRKFLRVINFYRGD